MNGVAQAKEELLAELYDSHAEELLRYVVYKIGDLEHAEDVVAETFLKVWKKLTENEAIEHGRGLVFTIAKSLIIDHYRKQQVRKHVPIDEILETLSVESTTVSDLEKKEDIERMLLAIRELKPEYADLLIMHYMEEIPVSEISVMLRETENNVRVRLHRAVATLKKQFAYERE